MQIVCLDDARLGRDRPTDLVRVDALRRDVEEDAAALAEQMPRRPEDEPGDEQARNRVEAVLPGEQDQEPGDRGPGERGEVCRQMEERAAHVQALAAAARQHHRRDEVHRHARKRDAEHEAATHVLRIDQPADGLVDDPAADERERGAVHLRRQHAHAAEAKGPPAGCRPAGHRRRAEGHRERGRVGEHVTGVGEERERAGENPEDDLGGEQADDQAERDQQRPAIRLRVVVRMRMVVTVLVRVLVGHASRVCQ